MRGGKAFASGDGGCVFRPALKCEGDSERPVGQLSKLSTKNKSEGEWSALSFVRDAIAAAKANAVRNDVAARHDPGQILQRAYGRLRLARVLEAAGRELRRVRLVGFGELLRAALRAYVFRPRIDRFLFGVRVETIFARVHVLAGYAGRALQPCRLEREVLRDRHVVSKL